MKKLLSIAILLCGLLLSGCLESAPKCNDETVVGLVKEIVLKDEGIFIKNGLTEESLQDYSRVIALIRRYGNQAGDDEYRQSISDLWEYSHEAAHISLKDFMTDSMEKQSKRTYCSATLEIDYSEMPQEMKQNQNYKNFKGPIFDGGKATQEVNYSARYTDDKKKIYVELLDR